MVDLICPELLEILPQKTFSPRCSFNVSGVALVGQDLIFEFQLLGWTGIHHLSLSTLFTK